VTSRINTCPHGGEAQSTHGGAVLADPPLGSSLEPKSFDNGAFSLIIRRSFCLGTCCGDKFWGKFWTFQTIACLPNLSNYIVAQFFFSKYTIWKFSLPVNCLCIAYYWRTSFSNKAQPFFSEGKTNFISMSQFEESNINKRWLKLAETFTYGWIEQWESISLRCLNLIFLW
jgi:hypothetical protein